VARVESRSVPARPSDATALVEFVPVAVESPVGARARTEAELSAVSKVEIEALRGRPTWQVLLWLALVLLVLMAIWRWAPR
jgi:hypothetical protein